MPLDRDHEDRGDLPWSPWRKWIPGEETVELTGGPRVSTPSVPVFWRRGWGWTELSIAPCLRTSASGLQPCGRVAHIPTPTTHCGKSVFRVETCPCFCTALSTRSPRCGRCWGPAGESLRGQVRPPVSLQPARPRLSELVPLSVRREGGPPPTPLLRRVLTSLS